MKPKFPTLNDGVAVLFRATAERDAKSLDPSTTAGLEKVAGLAFESRSNRQQDTELADAQGFSLTRKIRVRDMPQLDTSIMAQIGGILHEIGYIDRSERFAYLYLDAIKTDGQISLVSMSEGTDDIGNPVSERTLTSAWCRERSWKQARTTSTVDTLEPTLECVIRRADWDGQSEVDKDGAYTVVSAESRGDWVAITAARKAGDR